MTLRSKKEPTDVQGICVYCDVKAQRKGSDGKYRPYCRSCSRQMWEATSHQKHMRNQRIRRQRPYLLLYEKLNFCEACGFVAEHSCQLDVDHIDGSKLNTKEDNFQTLCANCHRLKTYINKDWAVKKKEAKEC